MGIDQYSGPMTMGSTPRVPLFVGAEKKPTGKPLRHFRVTPEKRRTQI